LENFNLTCTPIRHNVEALSLSMPYDYDTVIAELKKEDWGQHKNHSNSKRHILLDPDSNILKEVKQFLTSNLIKEQIIDSFYTNFPNIEYTWNGWSKKQMIERTVWDAFFIMDEPGYSMSKHVDTRTNVATGIVYLNKDADQRRTTIFYTDQTGSNQLKIDNRFGQGVISVNDSDTWHEVQNGTDEPRYVIVLVLLLLIDFYDAEKHQALFWPPPRLTL
jgi:hypothetical protein